MSVRADAGESLTEARRRGDQGQSLDSLGKTQKRERERERAA
jgi:hypothetical protein